MTLLDDTNPATPQNQSANSTSENINRDIQSSASDATSAAKQQAAKTFDEKRKDAATGIDSLAHAARTAAADLRNQDQEKLSHYVSEMASSVTTLADGLRKKSVDELIHDAKTIARNNPALFIAGSIAIGLGIARFAKATQRHADEDKPSGNYSDTTDSTRASRSTDLDYHEDDVPTLHTGFSTQVDRSQTDSARNGLGQQNGNGADTMGGTRYE